MRSNIDYWISGCGSKGDMNEESRTAGEKWVEGRPLKGGQGVCHAGYETVECHLRQKDIPSRAYVGFLLATRRDWRAR
jgi:hypothetical protein